jgi:hypothetical protein
MNEDQPAAPPASLTLVGLAWRMSALTLLALWIGLNFTAMERQSLPGAIVSLLLVPLLLSLAFRRINAWTPSSRMNLLLMLSLVSLVACIVVPLCVHGLVVVHFLPAPPSPDGMAIITNALAWITVAFLSLYTLALGVTLMLALAHRLRRNAP